MANYIREVYDAKSFHNKMTERRAKASSDLSYPYLIPKNGNNKQIEETPKDTLSLDKSMENEIVAVDV